MFDERFILHRYKATSHAAMAGAAICLLVTHLVLARRAARKEAA